jgi:phosphoribosyl 1,2-cyclic phosphodiesterase
MNMLNSQIPSPSKILAGDQLLVRINGTLPDISTIGSEEKSERAAEVKQKGISTNTSCSLFAADKTDKIFHVLVDVGQGIVKSVEKGISELGFSSSTLSSSPAIPDAVLITHSHDDHIKELPLLINKVDNESSKLKIFCTAQCSEQLTKRFPQLSESNNNKRISFNTIQPDKSFEIGPFLITPVLADHGDSSPSGSVIYMAKLANHKVIIGWDFLSLPNVNENLLWNPDLVILGTQSYNPHPQTGMISVSEAFELVRRWNAKECYIVHYRGLLDFEEATNQWFRGPVKAMTTDELQRVIDSHLQIIGSEGKFRIIVAREGMVWDSRGLQNKQEQSLQEFSSSTSSSDQSASSSAQLIEIESLEKYIMRIEKEAGKLKLMIEDRINRFNLEFDKPRKRPNTTDDDNIILEAQGIKGMLVKGPDLRIEIVRKAENEYAIKVRASKGKKKNVFNEDILVNNTDAQRLRTYIKENFAAAK